MVALPKALDDTRQRIGPALGDAREKIGPILDDTREKIGPILDDTREKIGPAIDDARGKIGPALGDARDRIGPVLDDARGKIGPILDDTREKLTPVAQQALETGQRRGHKAAVKLNLAEEAKSGHKLRNLLLLAVLAAVGFVVYKKLSGGNDSWDDAVGDSRPAAETSNETAPTAPLASEETVESPEATTPDNPLDETKVE